MESPNSSSPLTLHDLAKPSSVSKSFAATSSPLLSSSSLSPNLRYVRRKLTPSPRDLPLNSSLMGVVSSSTYLQAGLEKGDNCVMVCLCWKVTTILSLSFYQVEKGGENALFVSSYRGGVIAVADGFSSWVEQDVDPSSYVLQRAHGSCFSSVRYDPGFLVAMLEEVGVLKIGNVGDWDYLSFLDKCLAFEKEILIRFHSAGQIIFSTTPQEHYFDCTIHLMLPLYGGGGGSNMTKKIFVAAPDDKAGATSTSVSREVHLPDNEAQRRAVLIEPR
ncbi:hypothetical protein F2Q68_00008416 [Brassica cretica]|uniref:Uncharacterized protein n=1 Tax=Brassica cretica TaxID=69181 RepID=A0A8S9L2U9_BRACR|nr:hypothetical protein F2Q68_00008416 [Brassica cretica]